MKREIPEEQIAELRDKIAEVQHRFDIMVGDMKHMADGVVARSQMDFDIAMSDLIWEWKA
jgi:hypothetical protein